MKSSFSRLIVATLLMFSAHSFAEPEGISTSVPTPKERRVFEVKEVKLTEVIRSLARSARINVVASPHIPNETMTFRLENHTPREALDAVAEFHGLILEERNNVHYIRPWDAPIAEVATQTAKAAKALREAYMARGFTREEAIQLIIDLQDHPSLWNQVPKLSPSKKSK